MIEERVRGELKQVNRGGGMVGQVEHNCEKNEVYFSAEVGVNRIDKEDKILKVKVVNGGGEVEGGNENNGESGKKEERQISVNNVVIGKVANVVLNREEVSKLGDEVQALTEAEKDILAKGKVMVNSN